MQPRRRPRTGTARPPRRHAPGAHADGGRGGRPRRHGGGHDESLGAVMMHHVTDGYVVEYPGVCHGGFALGLRARPAARLRHDASTPETGKRVAGPLVLGALDLTPTKHVVMMWIASALLLLVVLLGASRKKALVPRGLYNFVETLVAFVRNEIAIKNIGKQDADRFVPYLVTAFFFILFMNLFGLVPFVRHRHREPRRSR